MIEASLVYIHAVDGANAFVGCGASIEQNLIATCRHVWRDAGGDKRGKVEVIFPRLMRAGKPARCAAVLIDACERATGADPDLVLLRAANMPDGVTSLQVARAEKYECGKAYAIARLPSRDTDRSVPGEIDSYLDTKGRRGFSQTTKTRYWFEEGSSGSPVFVEPGQQLAGIVSMAELGNRPHSSETREAYVVPGTVIWPFVESIARREFDDSQRAIEKALLEEQRSAAARELIFEIARSSGAGPAVTFEQSLADARSLCERGLKAIEAGDHGGNLGSLVDDLLKNIAERTRLGDFDGGSMEADRAFAEWERIEAERLEASRAAGITILEAGLGQDIIRRDYRSAASRVARIVDLEQHDPAMRSSTLLMKWGEFHREGENKGANVALEVAIEIARLVLTRTDHVAQRGAARKALGTSLAILGERERGTARLEEAVAAFGAALEEQPRAELPLDWASTQHNLGNVLLTLGERESGTARVEEAVAAFSMALEERTRGRVPLDWAMTQNSLGNALQALGVRERGTARLEEAVVAYREALEMGTRERVPLFWARVQNNLGNALRLLGEREVGTTRLKQAVAAFRAALKVQVREQVPLDWAMTQNSLGCTLAILGLRESGTAQLKEAAAAFRAACEEQTRDRVPLVWAMTQCNLGNALRALGEREGGTPQLEEAVIAYRASLEEWTRERVPLDWAMTQNGLGNALTSLGIRENGTKRLEEAVVAYQATLKEWTRERAPRGWAMTQTNLGNVLRTLGEREGGTVRLKEAVAAYQAALEEQTLEQDPLEWARSMCDQGVAFTILAGRTNDARLAEEALRQIETAYAVASPKHAPMSAYFKEQLSRAQATLDRLATGKTRG
jgi:tetratricopeptide (TPR) repeat protein